MVPIQTQCVNHKLNSIIIMVTNFARKYSNHSNYKANFITTMPKSNSFTPHVLYEVYSVLSTRLGQGRKLGQYNGPETLGFPVFVSTS